MITIFNHCKDKDFDETTTVIKQENITTLHIQAIDSSTGKVQHFFYRDLDREGPKPATQLDTITLDTQSIYYINLSFIDASNNNNIKNITPEIIAENNIHFVCLEHTIPGLSIKKTDTDGTYSVGIESKWFTKTKAEGIISIKLQHQDGLKNGSCNVGYTDIESDFYLKIK